MARTQVVTVEIEAEPERVWPVLADVTAWPSWSPTMTSVRLLDGAAFGPGARARVRQPKLPPALWRVTVVRPGQSFEWVSRVPGLTSRADHRLAAAGAGRCALTLEFERTGPLAWLAEPLFASLTRRYLELEAASLKRRCEAGPATP